MMGFEIIELATDMHTQNFDILYFTISGILHFYLQSHLGYMHTALSSMFIHTNFLHS